MGSGIACVYWKARVTNDKIVVISIGDGMDEPEWRSYGNT